MIIKPPVKKRTFNRSLRSLKRFASLSWTLRFAQLDRSLRSLKRSLRSLVRSLRSLWPARFARGICSLRSARFGSQSQVLRI